MRLRKLVQEDDAVSPVIGVILMVAITVILAAVIASFVLGLGGQTQTTPQASFSWNWDSGAGELTITHDSGESIAWDELYVRGDSNDAGATVGDTWQNLGGDASSSIGSTSAVASGDDLVISSSINGHYDLRVVWQPEEGDTSATLGEDTGPDA